MTYIKENKSDFTGCCLTNIERPITKLQKLYSPPRNLRAGNKSPVPFLEKPLWMGYISPARKVLSVDISEVPGCHLLRHDDLTVYLSIFNLF